MIIMFFVFTMLYRISEVVNQITYYILYSKLYKTYLDLGLYKTCNNSVYSLSRFSLSEYSNIMSEDFETLSVIMQRWLFGLLKSWKPFILLLFLYY